MKQNKTAGFIILLIIFVLDFLRTSNIISIVASEIISIIFLACALIYAIIQKTKIWIILTYVIIAGLLLLYPYIEI